MNPKRLFALISFLFLVGLIAFAFYWFYFRSQTNSEFVFDKKLNVSLNRHIGRNGEPIQHSDSGEVLMYDIRGTLTKPFTGEEILVGEMKVDGEKNTQPLRITLGGVRNVVMFGEIGVQEGKYTLTYSSDIAQKIKVGDEIMVRVLVKKETLRTATDSANLTPEQRYAFQQKETMNLLEQIVSQGTGFANPTTLISADQIAINIK